MRARNREGDRISAWFSAYSRLAGVAISIFAREVGARFS